MEKSSKSKEFGFDPFYLSHAHTVLGYGPELTGGVMTVANVSLAVAIVGRRLIRPRTKRNNNVTAGVYKYGIRHSDSLPGPASAGLLVCGSSLRRPKLGTGVGFTGS